MVIIYGTPNDGPIDYIADALENIGVDFLHITPDNLEYLYCEFETKGGKLVGEIGFSHKSYLLEEITGIYNRYVDFSIFPKYVKLSSQSPLYRSIKEKTDKLESLIATSSTKVLNKTRPMNSNCSKTYQMMLIQKSGFLIPETLITNSPEELDKFQIKYKEVIYKSSSGVRSIVKKLDSSVPNNNHLTSCPVMFQECLKGVNYRVHIVDEQVFATKIVCEALDYRYSRQDKLSCELVEVTLPKDIESKCLHLSKSLELPLAGIDLMQIQSGEWYCFEVNPSPGFTYYESNTGQGISEAIAKFLSQN